MQAVDWARDVLAERGTPAREVVEVHARAWSTVWRIDTGDERLFLKTAPGGAVVEPAVLGVLARHEVAFVQRPIAVSGEHVLLPDGGEPVRDDPDRVRLWPEALRHYAEVQRASEPFVEELVRAGVPDLRLDVLPDVAAELVARWAPERASRLPLVRDRAQELAELVPLVAVEHGDLHDGNAFARGAVPFDWGDACVSHPFLSLMVAAQEDVPGAVDAYLEVFTDQGDLDRAVELATYLARIPRAASWERDVDAAGGTMPDEYREAPRSWLLTLDGSDP